jgi:hypothetical protein
MVIEPRDSAGLYKEGANLRGRNDELGEETLFIADTALSRKRQEVGLRSEAALGKRLLRRPGVRPHFAKRHGLALNILPGQRAPVGIVDVAVRVAVGLTLRG